MNVWEIHPALVHFPIGLLLSAIATDLLAWWRPSESLNRLATGMLIAGVATGWLAANSGLLAFYTVPAHTHEAHNLMFWHMGAAVCALLLFTGVAIVRWVHRTQPVKHVTHVVGLIAAPFLMTTGALGGHIVYHGGAGIEPGLLASFVRVSHEHGDHAEKATNDAATGHGKASGKDGVNEAETPDSDMVGMEHGEHSRTPDRDMKKLVQGEQGKLLDKEVERRDLCEEPEVMEPGMEEIQQGTTVGEREIAATVIHDSGHAHQGQMPGTNDADKADNHEPTTSNEQSAHLGDLAVAKKHQSNDGEEHADEHSDEHGQSKDHKIQAVDERASKQSNIEGKQHQGHEATIRDEPRETTHQKHEKSSQQPMKKVQEAPKELPKVPLPDVGAADVPAGYRVEIVATDLVYPTSVEFDDDGTMYVAEGGYNYGDDVGLARVLRISSSGSKEVIADQLAGPVTDLLWHGGRLFISQRGKISVLESSVVRDLVTDLPSFGDHQNNQLTAGPDGKLYFGQGTATNSGVVGLDSFKMGWLAKYPAVCDVPAKDIRLRGEKRGNGRVREFLTPHPLAILADGMKHGDSQNHGMAGVHHDEQNIQDGDDNSDQQAAHKSHEASGNGRGSNDDKPRTRKLSENDRGFEANVQANRQKNQLSMAGMTGMEHARGKMQSTQHDSNRNTDGQDMDHAMKSKDGELDKVEYKPVRTAAFQPFGKSAQRDGLVRGEVKANGTILRMDPDGSNLEVYAWGLRNPFGVMWGPDKKLYASENGYDERGSRPVAHAPDMIWIISEGGWYGFPDYAGNVPVTDSRFRPQQGPAPEFLMRDHPPIEKPLAMLKPHAGAAKIDFSRNATFGFEGHMFLAMVGDMNPITGQHDDRTGFEVVRVDPQSGETNTFFRTRKNRVGPKGMEYVATAGPKRPVDVRFSVSGDALYVVDIGAMAIVTTAIGASPRPFPNTGVVWRISRDEKSLEVGLGKKGADRAK